MEVVVVFDDEETRDAFVREQIHQLVREVLEEEVAKGNFEYDPEADVYRRVRQKRAGEE